MQAIQTKEELNKEWAELLAKKRRLRATRAAEACQCPKCLLPFIIHPNFNQWVDKEAETIRCLYCGHVYTAVDKTIAERDAAAGVKFYAVDFLGVERRCERHPYRLEWLGGSVGDGVPIIVEFPKTETRRRPAKAVEQYVTWLVEALGERVPDRLLYRHVSSRQAK